MTIIMTAQEEGELWDEVAQSVVCDAISEPFEFTYDVPKQLGKGSFRGVQVHPEIWLAIMDYEWHNITNTLSATLAAFQITKSNGQTSDPVDPINFSIQIGEQRSRGVEFTIGGEILPGWNIIAGYAYTDARVTEDNDIPVGEFLRNVPKNAANLWTTYELQSGDYKGLGFGFGLVFVGEQQGDFPNSNFQVPSYVRADAALFYRRDNWRVGINVNNLFDVEYYETASRRTLVYPGAPFNVQATISYEF